MLEIEATYYLLRRLLGARAEGGDKTKQKICRLKADEVLMISIGSTSLGGKILSVSSDKVRIQFMNPVCANEGEKIALSRRFDRNFRLISWGEIKNQLCTCCIS